jgi:isoleucyl-tRNA synthetase
MMSGRHPDCDPELDKVFIVSEVELTDSQNVTDKYLSLEEVSGLWVLVEPAVGDKCERCWDTPDSRRNAAHSSLCHRCSEVVSSPIGGKILIKKGRD